MAEVKKTTAKAAEAKTEVKKATPKTTATKTTTAKKAPAKKVEAPKAEEVKVEEVKVEAPKAPAKKENKGPMLKIKLVKSVSGRLVKQQKTIEALGLRKIGSETLKPDNAQTRGMIFVVKHLVTVESVKEN